jgi:Zn finger protein HypA/HybF involved in hydrogenase expression
MLIIKVKCKDCPCEWQGTEGTPTTECPWCHSTNITIIEDKKPESGKLILG